MKKFQVSSFEFRFLLLPFAFCLLFFITGCETPEKVLKSNDLDYKKAKAISWYHKKQYVKCIPVMEELIGLMKGRESVEELYYMYCMANYNQGDYLISAYHFKYFYDQYPASEHSEECLYMYARSNEQQSPKPELDQTFTEKALESYQFFLSMFPESRYVKECNESVSKLRKKLEKKALNNAEMYYRTSGYKAAAASYENLLRDFPDIEEVEKVHYMIVKSYYKLADNSVYDKQCERFKNVIKAYETFHYKYPQSKWIDDAKKYEQQSHYLAVKSAFTWAEVAPLGDRERHFNTAVYESKLQLPFLIDEKQKKEFASWMEKGYFLMVKNKFLISEEKKAVQKLPALEQTLKTYYTFVDLFPKSKYQKEAERIFNYTTEQIKKLKGNG